MSEMICVIKKSPKPYTLILRQVAQSLRDMMSLGLYTYISSHSDSWQFYKSQLMQHCGVGRHKLEALFKTLIKHNLIKVTQKRGDKGRFSHIEIEVMNGEEFTNDESTVVLFTDVGQRELGNQHLIKDNKEIEDNNYNKIYSAKRAKPHLRKIQPPPNEENISKDIAIRAAREASPKKAMQIPASFQPNSKHAQMAAERQLDLNDQQQRFIDHFLAKGIPMKDWDRAFNNWLRKAADIQQSKKQSSNHRDLHFNFVRKGLSNDHSNEPETDPCPLLPFSGNLR